MAPQKQLDVIRVTRKGDTHSQIAPPSSKMVAGGKQCVSRSTITPTKTSSADLSDVYLHVWLLEPQQSRSRASLRQWQHELRLLKEDQPDQSMRQSGPFLLSGASVIRWTSGHPLYIQ